MTNEELYSHLAKVTAKALVETGVEGSYNSVAKSTSYDYPSIGCSQWEGSRADSLLRMIPGGEFYVGKSYYDIVNSGNLRNLEILLGSSTGIQAQLNLLSEDTRVYIDTLAPLFSDSKCLVYSATWCPTSTSVVKVFCQNRVLWGYNMNDLQVVRDLFKEQYWKAADVGITYYYGYANRAVTMYNYLSTKDIWS